MPIYEYQCHGCGQKFEVIQKFSDEPLTTHEVCGGKVDRLLGTPALQFKGSGWYINDYARSGKAKETPAESKDAKPAAKEGAASTETKTKATESKPAAAPSSDK